MKHVQILIEKNIFLNYELYIRGQILLNWRKFPDKVENSSFCMNLKDVKVQQVLQNKKLLQLEQNKYSSVEFIFDEWEETKEANKLLEIYEKCLGIIDFVRPERVIRLQFNN